MPQVDAIIPEDSWPVPNPPILTYGKTTVARVHNKSGGYLPAWAWVAPPGVGDAPQHVYTAFSLIPFSIDGPGDRPVTYLKSLQAPVVQPFVMRWQGMPVDGGSFLMTGLYAPNPQVSPSNDMFAGATGL